MDWNVEIFNISLFYTFLSLLSLVTHISPSLKPLFVFIDPPNRTSQPLFLFANLAHSLSQPRAATDVQSCLQSHRWSLLWTRRGSEAQLADWSSPIFAGRFEAELANQKLCSPSGSHRFEFFFFDFWFLIFDFWFCWGFWIWNLLEGLVIVVVVCGGGCSGGCWFLGGGDCHWPVHLYIGWVWVNILFNMLYILF